MDKEEETSLRVQYSVLTNQELIENLIFWRKRFKEDLATVNADERVKALRGRIDELEDRKDEEK